MLGIKSYGAYIPQFRIKAEEFRKVWGFSNGGFIEKAVMDFDEDCITMGVEAARCALRIVGISNLSFLALASTNYPYAEKMSSSTVAAMLGLGNDCFTSEHGNSMLAGSSAFMEGAKSLGCSEDSIVITTDSPYAAANSKLDHSLGAGAAAFVLSKDSIICEIEEATSFIEEYMGERYRLQGVNEIQDLEIAAYNKQAYQNTVCGAVNKLLKKMNRKPEEYVYFLLTQKDKKDPDIVLRKTGFNNEQIEPGLVFPFLGDMGAASSFIGLIKILENAKPEEKILLATYGSGSGCQAISLRTTENISLFKKSISFQQLMDQKKYIDYIQYLKLRRVII